MEARVVAAGRGWQWIIEGFALFRKRAPVWIALTALLALLWAASLMLPVLGSLLFNLLSPALFAGLMIGCRALEQGEDLKIMHLFAGFREQAAALVTLGGVYLVGTILVFGLVLLNADVPKLTALLSKSGADVETLRAATRGLAFALLVGATAYLPLLMLLWFAPLLVVFNGLAPLPAMKLSFAACFKNTAAVPGLRRSRARPVARHLAAGRVRGRRRGAGGHAAGRFDPGAVLLDLRQLQGCLPLAQTSSAGFRRNPESRSPAVHLIAACRTARAGRLLCGSSFAYSSISHFRPLFPKFTCTRASAPRPSALTMTPAPKVACTTL